MKELTQGTQGTIINTRNYYCLGVKTISFKYIHTVRYIRQDRRTGDRRIMPRDRRQKNNIISEIEDSR